jgi:urocanate hydratase
MRVSIGPWKRKRAVKALSIGICCNVVDLLQRLIDRNITPDTLTDQTSAHDELIGYFPEGLSVEQAKVLREKNPDDYINRSLDTMAKT